MSPSNSALSRGTSIIIALKIGMTGPIPKREFQQRLIDPFDRSRIRKELLKVRDGRLRNLRRRYTTLVLGASLAIGGAGIPLRMIEQTAKPRTSSEQRHGKRFTDQLVSDLERAETIAASVTSGVDAAMQTITMTPLTERSEKITLMTEATKEDFFKAEVPFGSLIYTEAKRHDLDPALVAAVVETESRFKPNARSHAGAQGLMQLVPRTGKWMGANNLMDPVQNVRAGAKYLKYLEQRFEGDETMVIAAYNAGEGNVRRFGGVPPFRETQSYVKKVLASKNGYAEQIASFAVGTPINATDSPILGSVLK